MKSMQTDRPQTLGHLLHLPYRALRTRIYRELAEQGYPEIRAAHSAVFRHLGPEGARITDLAAQAGMTKQSMGSLVDGLVGAGYLSIVPDPSDGRAKRVRLTRRGTAAVAALVDLSAKVERELARQLGADRMKQLRSLLSALGDAMDSAEAR